MYYNIKMEKFYCIHCDTPYDNSGNYHDSGTGHWEYVNTGNYKSKYTEIWYCCHICRDNNEPCETFFECQEDIDNVN